mgnify:CR=1 FL=1
MIIGRCFSSLMANDNILTQPQIAKDLFFYGFLLEKLCDRPLEKKEAMQLTKKKFIDYKNYCQGSNPLIYKLVIKTYLAHQKIAFLQKKQRLQDLPPAFTSFSLPTEMIAKILDQLNEKEAIPYIKAFSHFPFAASLLADFIDKRKLPICYLNHFPQLFFATFFHLKYINFKDWLGGSIAVQMCLQHADSVQELILSDRYNLPFPKGLKTRQLKTGGFGYHYDQELPVDICFDELEKLTFGHRYNKPLPNLCLNRLKYLEFGTMYNHPLPKKIELSSLKELVFGNHYDKSFAAQIQLTQLEKLTFGSCYNQLLPRTLQLDKLKYLKFGNFNLKIQISDEESMIFKNLCDFYDFYVLGCTESTPETSKF